MIKVLLISVGKFRYYFPNDQKKGGNLSIDGLELGDVPHSRARKILNFVVTFVTSVKLVMYKAFTSDKGVTKVTLETTCVLV